MKLKIHSFMHSCIHSFIQHFYLRSNGLFCIHRLTSVPFKDKKWHHMCVTYSGESGVIAQYLDGVREKSETGIAQEFDGGGTLTIGEAFIAQPYQITGFNLWDRVLPAMDIKDLATSCLKGIGNVRIGLNFPTRRNPSAPVNAPSVCLPGTTGY